MPDNQKATERAVDPNEISLDEEWNRDYAGFWERHGRSKEDYLDYVGSGEADSAKPPRVYQSGDHYVLADDGSHRVAASQELGRPITVDVVGQGPRQSQENDEIQEEEMSM